MSADTVITIASIVFIVNCECKYINYSILFSWAIKKVLKDVNKTKHWITITIDKTFKNLTRMTSCYLVILTQYYTERYYFKNHQAHISSNNADKHHAPEYKISVIKGKHSLHFVDRSVAIFPSALFTENSGGWDTCLDSTLLRGGENMLNPKRNESAIDTVINTIALRYHITKTLFKKKNWKNSRMLGGKAVQK